ncbi:MAG: molybdopterin-dependent oxidoreductase [Pseudomonadota bacterium]
MNEIIKTNCPRDCYDSCGIIVERKDNNQLRVLGDPDHPISRGRLCTKCAVAYNGVWQDENARLTQPLRRTGAKGSGEFEPISWDEALSITAERLNMVIAEDGPEAILHTHYSGTLSLLGHFFPSRFFLHLGASEVDPDTICNAAGHTAWHLMFGNSGLGFDPRTAKDANCILVWGANPSHSAPHAHEHWLPESPAKVIVVDPVITETAAAADLHLQPRPGTDAALAFSLLHALQAQGHFDQDFIKSHTVGFDEILPDIQACTPEWGEQQTGVPAETIRQAAQIYGAGPSMLWCGQGLQRQLQGGNVMRAAGLLPAATGNIGKPGTGFYYLNYTTALAGMDLGRLLGAHLATREPKMVSHMALSERLADPDEFKVFFSWNTNPLASAPNQQALRQACTREDLFTVVADCFMTDTARYADIVLPAASFLEFDDLTFGYFHLLLGAQAKVREPMGESLPNQEIFRRLARAMGLTEPGLFEEDEPLIAELLAQTKVGYDFEELKRRGHFYASETPLVFHEDLKFGTHSGHIEIASERAEKRGLPRIPTPEVAPPSTSRKFRLLSPASKWRMNDSYANDPHLQSQTSPAELILNTEDASTLGISSGQTIRVHNDNGSVSLQARIDDIVPTGTVLSYKGRWPMLEPDDDNINFLHIAQEADMANSTSVHSTEVDITPI